MPETPEFCPTSDRPCQWERERADLREEMREMRATFKELGDKIADIHQALAVGSERFKNQAAVTAEVGKLETEIRELKIIVTQLAGTVAILRTIVFGGVGVTLLTALGALLTLVMKVQ